MNILIVRLSSIGDVIHTLPAVKLLRDSFSGSKITWLVEKEAEDIVKKYPGIDRVIVWDKSLWKKLLKGFKLRSLFARLINYCRDIRSSNYDLAFDFQGLFKSAIILFFVRSKRKVGFTGAREGSRWFYNEKVISPAFNEHAINRNMKLLEAVGVRFQDPFWYPLFDRSDKEELLGKIGAGRLHEPSDIITVHPNARWKTKILPSETVVMFCRMVLERKQTVVALVGGSSDRWYNESIKQNVDSERIINLAGKISLTELASLLSCSRLLVSMDSGPMHIGSAVGVPVVSVFGPTAPWRTGPFGKVHAVIRKELPCSPCYKKKKCPEGHHRCMGDVSAEEIFKKSLEFL